MSKEELFDRGWEVTYSGPSPVSSWGKHVVYLHHALKGAVAGYGDDEQASLNNAAEVLKKSRGEV